MLGKFVDIVIALIIFSISVVDLYKGILMSFRDQHPLLFMAQIGFGILRLLPMPVREHRYQKAMDVYIKRRRLYGVYAMVGGFSGVLISILMLLNL